VAGIAAGFFPYPSLRCRRLPRVLAARRLATKRDRFEGNVAAVAVFWVGQPVDGIIPSPSRCADARRLGEG